mmetsp:Transcript_36385/g.87485  ORF Transcript_36385/g.87485 Transcript_36385/m.87485 type:complete len:208 (+) Transcript_36385:258-881(+)
MENVIDYVLDFAGSSPLPSRPELGVRVGGQGVGGLEPDLLDGGDGLGLDAGDIEGVRVEVRRHNDRRMFRIPTRHAGGLNSLGNVRQHTRDLGLPPVFVLLIGLGLQVRTSNHKLLPGALLLQDRGAADVLLSLTLAAMYPLPSPLGDQGENVLLPNDSNTIRIPPKLFTRRLRLGNPHTVVPESGECRHEEIDKSVAFLQGQNIRR